MRPILRYLLIALWTSTIVLAPGCAMFQPSDIPVSPGLSQPAQSVQKAINEANVTLTATANVVAQNLADGILTKPEAQGYVAKLKGYAADVDNAQKLLDAGLVVDAQKQSELLSRLIIALHKEVASRRRQ